MKPDGPEFVTIFQEAKTSRAHYPGRPELRRVGLALSHGQACSSRGRVSWSADFQSKFAYQRINLISLAALLLLGTAINQLPRVIAILTVLAALLVLMFPLRFALSEEEITINGRSLRSWSELSSFRVQERRLILKGEGRLNFVNVYLPRDEETRKLALKLTRQKLREESTDERLLSDKRRRKRRSHE